MVPSALPRELDEAHIYVPRSVLLKSTMINFKWTLKELFSSSIMYFFLKEKEITEMPVVTVVNSANSSQESIRVVTLNEIKSQSQLPSFTAVKREISQVSILRNNSERHPSRRVFRISGDYGAIIKKNSPRRKKKQRRFRSPGTGNGAVGASDSLRINR